MRPALHNLPADWQDRGRRGKGKHMVHELNRSCPFCGEKLKAEIYHQPGKAKIEYCAYCDNCEQFCTDCAAPSRVLEELKCIEQN